MAGSKRRPRSTDSLRRTRRWQRPTVLEALEARQLLTASISGLPTVYATIQAAVNAASPGATVLVTPGTYSELVSVGKKLTILGAQAGVDARSPVRFDAAVADESIIDGRVRTDGTRTSGFYVSADGVTIDGFTVQNTNSTSIYGAGIVIAPNRSGTRVVNNVVQNNVSGLFLANSSATAAAVIQHNLFRNNNNDGANGGRGIYSDQSYSGGTLRNVTIDGNAFVNNRGGAGTTGLEAGISLESSVAGSQTGIRITNNTFDRNGKAVLFFNVTDATISGNVVTYTRDWYSGTLRFEGNNHDVRILNNTVYANTGPAVAIDSKGVPGDSSGFVVSGNNFYGNSATAGGQVAVVVQAERYTGSLDARNNYWGDPSGPGGDGPGTGDAVYGIGHVVSGSSWYVAKGGTELFSPWSATPIGTLSTPYWGVTGIDGVKFQAEDFNHGGEGIAYHDLDPTNTLGQYRTTGVDLGVSADAGGGFSVSSAKAGEWLSYDVSASVAGTYALEVRYANGQAAAGTFHFEVDGVAVGGSMSATPTGGAQAWATLSTAAFDLTAGQHVVRLVLDANGPGGSVADFNWFRLNRVTATSLPATPTALVAAATSPWSVSLTWSDNATDETGYVVERSAAGGAWTPVASLGANVAAYVDASVLPATAYRYRVQATGAAGPSAYGAEAAVATPALPAVTYLSDLAWVSTVNGWGPVERDQSNGGQDANDGTPITLNGTAYAKGLGVHAASEVVYNLAGTFGGFASDVGVDDRKSSISTVVFQVYGDGTLLYDSGVMNPTSATKSVSLDVTNVGLLRLVVTDAGDGNENDHADWAGARLTAAAPATATIPPTGLTAAVDPNVTGKVSLAWTDNATGETGYKVERSTDGVTFAPLATLPADSVAYVDTSVVGGVTYTYRVQAAAPSGSSAYSNTATATPPAVAAVTYLSDMPWVSATNGWGPIERDQSVGGEAANDGGPITLNGTTYAKGLGAHAASEVVYSLAGKYGGFASDVGVDDRKTSGSTIVFQVYGDGALLYDSGVMNPTSTTKSISLDVTGVSQLRLVVTDGGDGNDFDHADWAGARLTAAAPATATIPPTGLTASVDPNVAGRVSLAWIDNATGESGYKVERSTDGVTFAPLAALPASSTAYVDATAAGGLTYTYRVRASAPSGDSAYSNVASATPPAIAAVTYLSDLAWVSATNGWGPVERDQSVGGQAANDGGPIILNGVTYAKGLGAHAPSEIVYNLDGKYGGFESDVGVDDRKTSGSTIVFQVYGDGTLLYDSGVMNPNTVTKSVSLDVTGVAVLRLVVTDAGDGNGYDHADWAGARLTAAAPTSASVAPTDLVATADANGPSTVRLTWKDNATGETAYKVERSTDGVTFVQVAALPADSTSYADATVASSSTYSYRVRASAPSADSAYSNVATASTPAVVVTTYLSDLQWTSATNGWGPVERDQSVGGQAASDGGTLKLNGVTYAKGLGTNAPSEIVYDLDGSYGTFATDVGVDDRQTTRGTVVFQVYADGALVFDSGLMTATSDTKSVSLTMAGVRQLRLVVTDGGDGNAYDHADWAGARLVKVT